MADSPPPAIDYERTQPKPRVWRRVPWWLWAHLAASYLSGATAMAVFGPGDKRYDHDFVIAAIVLASPVVVPLYVFTYPLVLLKGDFTIGAQYVFYTCMYGAGWAGATVIRIGSRKSG